MRVLHSERRAQRSVHGAPSTRHRARFFSILVLLIMVVGSSIIYATEGESVTLTVGRSMVLDTGRPIARVSLTSADVADALVTSASELLINGKTPGTISMFVWDRQGAIHRYEVVVHRDLAQLSTQLRELFPGESIAAQNNGRSIVLSGSVTSKEVIDRAVSVAAGYVDKKEDIVPLLQVQPGRSNQVLLHVRFAEVSRSAMTELGAGFFTSPTGVKQALGRVTTEQFPSVGFDELKYTKPVGGFGKDITSNSGKFTFSDFLNLFLFSEKYDLGATIRALQTKGLFQSLAEPNLVAESGKEASFLAGGEIPVPVAQGAGGSIAISVVWKEFGIRLNFNPVVTGTRVHLKVRPEVSTLDFNNAVVLQGFRIPALSTRRTETELELENGQTFAIAGLLNNTMNSALQKMPGIGDIPILGLLFQSKAAQKGQTELVVMITPEILPNGSSGAAPNLPRLIEPFMPPPAKTIEPPPPAYRAGPSGAAADAAPVSAPPPVEAVKPDVKAARPDAKAQAAELKRQTKLADDERRKAAQQQKDADARKKRDDAAALEEARRTESAAREQAKRDEHAAQEQAKRDQQVAAEQAKRDQQTAQEQAKRDEKAAKEKAKRDAEAAKKQAEINKAAMDAAAKQAAEDARQQAAVEKRKQQALDEAQARLKAAEAVYQAELAKRGTRNQ